VEFKREVWSGATDWGAMLLWMVFEVMKGIIKGVSVDGEE
jgi:hypothetical protein